MAVQVEEVTEEQMEVGYSGAAISSNKFFITVGPQGARIAFAEGRGGGKFYFRTAVVLPFQDAIALKDILGQMLAQIEAQFAAVAEKDNG